ncbi:MAG: hypothetical protein A2Z24_02400 [Candidatus Woykebacteria bacterium RBG_16_44_10]|uniref:Uncharacterized protein n=1 Tax=Candidatus Woykebacteria bacterium RBG_16_44_10 TaxID=1802597 RepID=A0A1G1WE41_9BACT|nr:MAG: hypothetical protein A2Z24_02400 [Candidatus Woykebacteria bacterium RBG_16_44_10]
MKCPICGSETILKNNTHWCPKCRIFPGENLSLNVPEEPDPGKIYQQRARRSFYKRLAAIFIFLLIVLPPLALFTLNYTSFGYREKIFYNYRFTNEASSYLRKHTSITVFNISEKKPFGFTHSGYWSPGSNNVTLNTANDEVAVHEFAHAWWEKLRQNKNVRESIVNDTIKLSQMEDPRYAQTIKRARWIVSTYCNCPNQEKIDYSKADDHHFYAYMADFTMGRFKDGPHALPSLMWKYFDGLFTGNPRVTPCYETNSCYFPQNNKMQ